MKISYSRYELVPKQSLNHRAHGGAREGALLRVEFADDSVGYSDLHPWTELGDAPLGAQLEILRSGGSTPLSRNSLGFAQVDAQARKHGRSLGEGLVVPESHFLVTNLLATELVPELEWAESQGFRLIKLKTGREPAREAHRIREAADAFPHLRFRLDFNGKLTESELAEFLDALGPTTRRIDWIEDPVAWDTEKGFPPAPVRLALDQGVGSATEQNAPEVLVIKPAVDEAALIALQARKWNRKLVVTSYLDHPIGQIAAAWTAAKLQHAFPDLVEPCGLASHFAYGAHAFSERLEMSGARLLLSSDAGFGFADLLEKQDWRDLSELAPA